MFACRQRFHDSAGKFGVGQLGQATGGGKRCVKRAEQAKAFSGQFDACRETRPVCLYYTKSLLCNISECERLPPPVLSRESKQTVYSMSVCLLSNHKRTHLEQEEGGTTGLLQSPNKEDKGGYCSLEEELLSLVFQASDLHKSGGRPTSSPVS